MALSFDAAISAYNSAARRILSGPDDGNQPLGAQRERGPVQGPSFQDLVGETARNAVTTMRRGEAMSAAAVTGTADLADVVQAVNNAELTLQSVIAVRDRVMNAYQEILRMPI